MQRGIVRPPAPNSRGVGLPHRPLVRVKRVAVITYPLTKRMLWVAPMSKLGTHDTDPTTSEPLPSDAAHEAPVCVVCGAPATERCERCHVGLCLDHVTRVARMFWDSTWAYAPQWLLPTPIETNRHYVPVGDWHVCGSCRRIIAARNAREIAQDRADTRHQRIQAVVILAFLTAIALFIVVWDILTMTGYLHGPPIPPHNLP